MMLERFFPDEYVVLYFTVAHANIWDLITQFVSAPLSNVADTLATTMIENLFVTVLWVFGIHGASIAGSITQPILYPLLQANTASFAACGFRGL